MITLTRRKFLRVSALTAATTAVAACAAPPPVEPSALPAAVSGATLPPPESLAPTSLPAPAVPPAAVSRFREAPVLAQLVAQGALDPVDARLPEIPNVCPVAEAIGNYGGTWRRAVKGMADRYAVTNTNYKSLAWHNYDLSLRPALCESWEMDDEAKVWTIHLRPGTRWSDGTPFTTEDVAWAWTNVFANKDLTPRPPGPWSSGSPSVLATLETPDASTAIIAFGDANPLFAYQMTGNQPFVPGHYLQQFHVDFADRDELSTLIQEAGVETWVQLFQDRSKEWLNPELPVIGPWIPKTRLGDGELHVMERNPYYWEVDPDGQQLPYVDSVQHRVYDSLDVFNMWIVGGDIDLQGRGVDFANYTLFKENERTGDYTVFVGQDEKHTCFAGNMTSRDPRFRELFQDRRVRRALSYAVDRDAVNDLIYDGLAVSRQYSPLEQSPQYYPRLSNAHLEYDPDAASALLDEAGYVERDGEGFRRWKDNSGETISIVMEGYSPAGSASEDHALMVCQYFANIGIKCAYKYIERSLYTERVNANAVDATWPFWNHLTILPINSPIIWTNRSGEITWAIGWLLWDRDPSTENAEEPPEGHWQWQLWDYDNAMATEPDEGKRNELFQKIMDIWAEELPQVGYLGQLPALVIVKNGIRNYLPGYPVSPSFKSEHLLNSQTFFWEEPDRHV